MTDLAFLEALRGAFWPLYLFAMVCGVTSAYATGRRCVIRVVLAFAAASLAQWAWEGEAPLTWWQHMAIDVPVFIVVTMPPRHYWQSMMGALVLVQLIMHAVWFAAQEFPNAARLHWEACILIGYVKCSVLILWSGGASVEAALGNCAGAFARLLHRPAVENRA